MGPFTAARINEEIAELRKLYGDKSEQYLAERKEVDHLRAVMRECVEALNDNDEHGALAMLRTALARRHAGLTFTG